LLAGALLLLEVDPPVPPPPHAAAATIARELMSARAKADLGRLGPEVVVIPLLSLGDSRRPQRGGGGWWIGEKLAESVWLKTSRPSRMTER